MKNKDIVVFGGNAHPQLSYEICNNLNLPLGKANISQFNDGEVQVEILDNVRGKDVFVIQPTCSPVNDNLMELLIIGDALKRASADRITAVTPYFGYSRQDKRSRSVRVPITAKLVANMICEAGFDRVLAVDLHSDQIQGFFDIPVDNIYSTPVLLDYIKTTIKDYDDLIVVSPDVGGILRARSLAKYLNSNELAIVDKRRPKPNVSEVMNIIGNVEGHDCFLIDDIVDTGGTLSNAATALKDNGARSVRCYCTHPVLSAKAHENFKNTALDEIIVSNTIPLNRPDVIQLEKIIQISISDLLSETIMRIHTSNSVSSLFL